MKNVITTVLATLPLLTLSIPTFAKTCFIGITTHKLCRHTGCTDDVKLLLDLESNTRQQAQLISDGNIAIEQQIIPVGEVVATIGYNINKKSLDFSDFGIPLSIYKRNFELPQPGQRIEIFPAEGKLIVEVNSQYNRANQEPQSQEQQGYGLEQELQFHPKALNGFIECVKEENGEAEIPMT